MIRRLNEIMLSLLTHASIPPTIWVEAIHTSAYLHNILPTKLLKFKTPLYTFYLRETSYSHLRVFWCLCYPNQSATRPNKLTQRSTRCIFLGYPADFLGYQCKEISTGKIILSRHVTFDENIFPYSDNPTPNYSPLEHDLTSPIITHPTLFQPTPTPTPPSDQAPTIRFTYQRRTQPDNPTTETTLHLITHHLSTPHQTPLPPTTYCPDTTNIRPQPANPATTYTSHEQPIPHRKLKTKKTI